MVSTVAEAIISIAAIVAATFVAVTIFSSIFQISDTSSLILSNIKEKIDVDVKIITGYVATDYVKVWIKNVGRDSILEELIIRCDVMFGKKGELKYIPYQKYTDTSPYWNYTIVNDYVNPNTWDPEETIELIIQWDTTLETGDYVLIFTTYAGSSDRIVMSK